MDDTTIPIYTRFGVVGIRAIPDDALDCPDRTNGPWFPPSACESRDDLLHILSVMWDAGSNFSGLSIPVRESAIPDILKECVEP